MSVLLPKPARTASNYRLYPDEAVTRILFIRRAQQLGFTLKEIKELMELQVSQRTTCAEVRSRAEAKIADIQARVRSLREMGPALAQISRVQELEERVQRPVQVPTAHDLRGRSNDLPHGSVF